MPIVWDMAVTASLVPDFTHAFYFNSRSFYSAIWLCKGEKSVALRAALSLLFSTYIFV